MTSTAKFAAVASLAGDPARAGMLHALMDGRALTASELARVAGVTPQTASGHLARMVDAGLLSVCKQGRHRYHRIASQGERLDPPDRGIARDHRNARGTAHLSGRVRRAPPIAGGLSVLFSPGPRRYLSAAPKTTLRS